jgi:leucyl-tRNA synthetase
MFLVGSAEPWQDFDWRNELVASTRKQIERFWNTVYELGDNTGEGSDIDIWLISRLQYHIRRTTEALDNFQTRQALQESFFAIESDLKWYRRRISGAYEGSRHLQELCSVWVRLLAPIIPFTCEYLWKKLHGEGLVSFADWPVASSELVKPNLELAEELLARTVEDIESILKIIQIEPASISIYCAPGWKQEIFSMVAGAPDKNLVIREIMKNDAMKKRGKEATDATRQCTTLIHRLPPQLVDQITASAIDEKSIFENACSFLQKEFGVPVKVLDAGQSMHAKALSALPFKPAIVIE